jgi:hypothetical protein
MCTSLLRHDARSSEDEEVAVAVAVAAPFGSHYSSFFSAVEKGRRRVLAASPFHRESETALLSRRRPGDRVAGFLGTSWVGGETAVTAREKTDDGTGSLSSASMVSMLEKSYLSLCPRVTVLGDALFKQKMSSTVNLATVTV